MSLFMDTTRRLYILNPDLPLQSQRLYHSTTQFTLCYCSVSSLISALGHSESVRPRHLGVIVLNIRKIKYMEGSGSATIK